LLAEHAAGFSVLVPVAFESLVFDFIAGLSTFRDEPSLVRMHEKEVRAFAEFALRSWFRTES